MKINKYKNMKTIYKIAEKRAYCTPDVICIKMDNEISLALESANPDGDPTFSSNQQFFNNDPFKSNMG
jgi:hypothetical protein